MTASGRIRDLSLAKKVVSAEDAPALIGPGETAGVSAFTGAGSPEVVPPSPTPPPRRSPAIYGLQTPHLLDEASSCHDRYLRTGSTMPAR